MYNVMTRMPVPASTWRDYFADMKEILFKDFMDKHWFTSNSDCDIARAVWEQTCMGHYSDHLNRARDKTFEKANSNNLADVKGHGPRGLRTEVWNGLVDIWLTKKWMRKSEAARRNKTAMPDALKHTRGSISFGQHKYKMEAELKHLVSYRDLYAKVHKKKDESYVSERSRNFIESYNIGINNTMHASSSEVVGPSRSTPLTQDITEAVNIAVSAAVATTMTSFVQTQLILMFASFLSTIQSENVAPQAPSQGEAASEGREDDDYEDKDEANLD